MFIGIAMIPEMLGEDTGRRSVSCSHSQCPLRQGDLTPYCPQCGKRSEKVCSNDSLLLHPPFQDIVLEPDDATNTLLVALCGDGAEYKGMHFAYFPVEQGSTRAPAYAYGKHCTTILSPGQFLKVVKQVEREILQMGLGEPPILIFPSPE